MTDPDCSSSARMFAVAAASGLLRLNLNESSRITRSASEGPLIGSGWWKPGGTATDADILRHQKNAPPAKTERRRVALAHPECGLDYGNSGPWPIASCNNNTTRILLKEELLPLRQLNGTVEVATSRLFATQRAGCAQDAHRAESQANCSPRAKRDPARNEKAPGRRRRHHRLPRRGKRLRGRWMNIRRRGYQSG